MVKVNLLNVAGKGNKEVELLGVYVEVYEDFNKKLWYEVMARLYSKDIMELCFAYFKISERVSDIRVALDLKNEIQYLLEEYRDKDEIEVFIKIEEFTLRVEKQTRNAI